MEDFPTNPQPSHLTPESSRLTPHPSPLTPSSPLTTHGYLRLRLSLLMFLQYSVPGAMLPMFSLWLKEDRYFSSVAIGGICATQAVAAMFTPLAAGQFADRWFPAER